MQFVQNRSRHVGTRNFGVLLLLAVGAVGIACAKPESAARIDLTDGRCTRQADTPEIKGPCSLNLLSYNVRGLSPLLLNLPTTGDEYYRSASLGWLARDYDLALLQEDFEYTDRITGGPEFSFVERGNTARWGWLITPLRILTAPLRWIPGVRFSAPYGAGITIAAPDLLPLVDDSIDGLRRRNGVLARRAFENCNGWIRYANDCLSTKGLLGMRLLLRNGAEIDVYTTHLDAGDHITDRKARREQLRFVRSVLEEQSAGRAIILGGDLNVDLDLDPETEQLRTELLEPLGLSDTGVHAQDELWGTRVDYVLFRSSDDVRLEIARQGSGEDMRFRHPRNRTERRKAIRYKNILSDHPALAICFRITHRNEQTERVILERRASAVADPTLLCKIESTADPRGLGRNSIAN